MFDKLRLSLMVVSQILSPIVTCVLLPLYLCILPKNGVEYATKLMNWR